VHAVELDAPRAFGRWLQEHRRALGDILEHGTWLDREDVESLLGLSVPGMDELAGMLEIVQLASSNYDCIVVDTAPTGHALRLLAAPETVGAVAAVLEALQYEHRLIREQFARVSRPEAADRLIALLAGQANQMRALLRDSARTTMRWVTLPEELSVAEAEDALAALEAAGIRVPTIIVNRVTPDGPPCPVCDGRRIEERRVMARMARLARAIGKRRSVVFVPAVLLEPRGIGALASLSAHVTSRSGWKPAKSLKRRRHLTRRVVPRKARPAFPADRFRDLRLLFFGGKGGVGKTTASAAVALQLAGAQRERRILLLSTDPAHSLGDVFRQPVGDHERSLRGGPSNLRVRELDAARAFAARRSDLEAALNEISAVVGVAATEGTAGADLGGLIDLAPPGVDELFGLVALLKDLGLESRGSSSTERRHDLVIIDTAPTGHALRLLQMPEIAREWVQGLLRVLLKYRNLVRPGQLAAELVDLSKSIRTLQRIMRNPREAHFIVVARAAALPRLETGRLLNRLKQLGLEVPVLFVNGSTFSPGRCPRCRRTADAEKREVSVLTRACRQRFRDCVIIQTPLVVPPPRGVAALERWTEDWIATP
jgi:arsenite-transporting ATPase